MGMSGEKVTAAIFAKSYDVNSKYGSVSFKQTGQTPVTLSS